MTGGVWHLLVRARMPATARMRIAEEEKPDADPQRERHRALDAADQAAPTSPRSRSRVRAGVLPNQSRHARLNELCSR